MTFRRSLVPLAVLAGVLSFAAALWLHPVKDQTLWAVRYTARIGLPFVLLAYVAGPLRELVGGAWTHTIAAARRQLGLSFAVSHTFHLIAIAWFVPLHPEWLVAPENAGWPFSVIVYLLMYAMAFTSNQAAMVRLGPWWGRMHRIGIHLLLIIYAFNYVVSVLPHNQLLAAVFGPLIIAAFVIRLLMFARRRALITGGPAPHRTP